jgi:hypothetical protein
MNEISDIDKLDKTIQKDEIYLFLTEQLKKLGEAKKEFTQDYKDIDNLRKCRFNQLFNKF